MVAFVQIVKALVLDKETGVSKPAHLKHVREFLEIDYPEIMFIDDKVNYLDSVASLGVRCALATWGYNGPREHRLAKERGYRVYPGGRRTAAVLNVGPAISHE